MPETYRNVTIGTDGVALGEKSFDGETFYNFESSYSLLWISMACDLQPAADEIWDIQDGYGQAGYTPVQGWDWSGIRDSSPAAVSRMLAVAVAHLPVTEFAARLDMDPVELSNALVAIGQMRHGL